MVEDNLRLSNDITLMLTVAPLILFDDPDNIYIRRLKANAQNHQTFDRDYQIKLTNYFKKRIHKQFETTLVESDKTIDDSVSRSLNLILETVNQIKTEDPVGYYNTHYMQLPNEQLSAMNNNNHYNFRDLSDNLSRGGSPGSSLSILKEAYNTAFENSYKSAYRGIERVFSSAIQKKQLHEIAESILCFQKTISDGKTLRSDFRLIRNNLEHPGNIRREDHYHIQLDEETAIDLGINEIMKLTIVMGVKSTLLAFICNLLMMMRMYELSLK